jgi:hypothetical protein
VRVHGDVMLVNNELFRATTGRAARTDFEGGIKVYDTSDKTTPRQIGPYKSLGAHRFDSDGAYAYISSEENGFVGDIVVILDLADPGQARADRPLVDAGAMGRGGETRTWQGPPSTAAITRCAAATGSTPATGTAGL